MKNRIILFVAVCLTFVGFVGVSSILMSEALTTDIYGSVYFKSLYLNKKDIYNDDYLLSRNSFFISSDDLENENVVTFELFNNGYENETIALECLSKNGIIEIQNNNQEYMISKLSGRKESIVLTYDSNISDSLECKINIFD